MVKLLRKTANWLENKKCSLHNKWNGFLENLKTKCVCEKLTK